MAYIDKAKAIQSLTDFKENHLSIPKACLMMIDTCITLIKIIPTADVVEVIRCKGCQWATERTKDNELFQYQCRNTIACGKPRRAIDFCSYGERKE